ncbi:hypothetical protein COOONC_15040 [Cooperia oncophora]
MLTIALAEHVGENAHICTVLLTRTNQKSAIVACTANVSTKNENRSDTIREYNFDGFHVVFLPFAEDIRDVSEKMKCPEGDWPKQREGGWTVG